MEDIKKTEAEFADEEKTTILVEYLSLIFSNKNRLVEVVHPNRRTEMIAEKLITYAVTKGVKDGQIKFKWTNDQTPNPWVRLGEDGKFVEVTMGRQLFKTIWADSEKTLPIKAAAYMPDPEAYIGETFSKIKNGKLKLLVEPDKLKTTGVLRSMMIETYTLWRSLP